MRIYYEFENTNVKVSCDIIHTSNRFAHQQEYSYSFTPDLATPLLKLEGAHIL
jgi:hypothetical protein